MSSTVPPRRAHSNFEYGDAFEALAVGTSLMNAISTYCVVCSVVACELRIESPDCDLLTYQPANALRALTSYGVSGILALDQASPFLAIPFCSAVDKSFLFSPLASSGDSGVFLWDAAYSQVIAAVPAVRDAVMDSAEPCPKAPTARCPPRTRRRRPASARARPHAPESPAGRQKVRGGGAPSERAGELAS